MLNFRPLFLVVLCLMLLGGSGCQRKGIIPCPKPISKRNKIKITGGNSQGLEAIKVPKDKNGRVKRGIW
ncbi:hypothetical protein CLV24_10314 [Pontibacter ummariensis]|uniref:Lipoprotein n=1 Tax=Pontibacter ummariensis TaxID=1610492 RepID=A0A239CWN3_9BACT|nr:hypothetical protein CLV24_10314 [Pontibacter ummariensis]SNS24666.1 hypothetical protein SAMN06296052_103299 [Pontibacter ummariensis]